MVKLDNTKKFYEKIKTISIIDRIFFWKSTISLLMESYSEIKDLDKVVDEYNQLKSEKEFSIKEINKLTENINEKKNDILRLEEKNTNLINENNELKQKNATYENLREKVNTRYDELYERKKQLENDRLLEQEKDFEEMKKTWKKHEEDVESKIKLICQKYTLEYLGKNQVPFRNKPDNTVQIADEYIIFDAKSPANDNLDNFPTYIKSQVGSIKKYVSENNVKKELFLVVPTNTIDKLEYTFYDMSDYKVYIITTDSLEPIILALKKIQDYEFAEKLSPEDRNDICKVIGQFTHHTKRRIEIDNFFNENALKLFKSTENLPEDIYSSVEEHEINFTMSMPSDKRNKKLQTDKLDKKTKKLNHELNLYNIKTNSEDLLEK